MNPSTRLNAVYAHYGATIAKIRSESPAAVDLVSVGLPPPPPRAGIAGRLLTQQGIASFIRATGVWVFAGVAIGNAVHALTAPVAGNSTKALCVALAVLTAMVTTFAVVAPRTEPLNEKRHRQAEEAAGEGTGAR